MRSISTRYSSSDIVFHTKTHTLNTTVFLCILWRSDFDIIYSQGNSNKVFIIGERSLTPGASRMHSFHFLEKGHRTLDVFSFPFLSRTPLRTKANGMVMVFFPPPPFHYSHTLSLQNYPRPLSSPSISHCMREAGSARTFVPSFSSLAPPMCWNIMDRLVRAGQGFEWGPLQFEASARKSIRGEPFWGHNIQANLSVQVRTTILLCTQ